MGGALSPRIILLMGEVGPKSEAAKQPLIWLLPVSTLVLSELKNNIAHCYFSVYTIFLIKLVVSSLNMVGKFL